jgi:multicomponent Na+:H+ antiporter subunit E
MNTGGLATAWRRRTAVVRRVPVFAFLWWILAGGSPASWLLGLPVVLAAAILSVAVSPASSWRISVRGLALFLPYFVWRSMVGSVDVAWRALHPGLPISPALARFPLRLDAHSPARVFFADVVSLLPGTLSADLQGGTLLVHVLSATVPEAIEELRRLEARAAAVFGLTLPAAPVEEDDD